MNEHNLISGADTGLSTRRIVQLYEVQHDVDLETLAGRIYGLARIGLAATDTVLALDLLHKGGFAELFEAIAQTADDLSTVLAEQEDQAIRARRAAQSGEA